MRTLFFLILLFAGPGWAALDGRQQELKELRERIAQLRDEAEKATEDKKEAADSLRDSERRISEVNRALMGLSRDEQRVAGSMRELDQQSNRLQASLADQERRLAELLRHRYINGGEDSLRLLISGRNPSEISRDLEYYDYIGRARAVLIQEHRLNLERLEQVRRETTRQRAALDEVKKQQLAQRRTLGKEKESRRQLLERLSVQIRQQRAEIDTLVRDEERLARLIEKLRRLASVAKPVKKKARAGVRGVPEVVDRVADSSLANIRFSALRGKLALPVAGEITARFGEERDGGGPAWKGLFIRSKNGADVRAVANGTVVFSDWLRGFGNLLILDHGSGYLSLYSNNESLYKQAGEDVRAGDVVATVGNTGGHQEPGLYFELRRQGQPFDPMSWVR